MGPLLLRHVLPLGLLPSLSTPPTIAKFSLRYTTRLIVQTANGPFASHLLKGVLEDRYLPASLSMDDSQLSRRSRPLPPRPESSASSQTKMTPSSSNNSSSVNLPRNQSLSRGAPGASLLQERLRERKGENLARRGSIDTTERTLPSSPLKGKEERRPSSSGTGKGMGVKQIEEVRHLLLLLFEQGLTILAACLYLDEAKLQPQARITPPS